MIKVEKFIVEKHGHHRIVKADLLADTAVEVEEIGANCDKIQGLKATDKLAMGSTCFTCEQEFGILNSTGNWRF